MFSNKLKPLQLFIVCCCWALWVHCEVFFSLGCCVRTFIIFSVFFELPCDRTSSLSCQRTDAQEQAIFFIRILGPDLLDRPVVS